MKIYGKTMYIMGKNIVLKRKGTQRKKIFILKKLSPILSEIVKVQKELWNSKTVPCTNVQALA
jgi:hypothetical protein